jgi:orotate phosphoribosyltransferase
MKFSEKIAKISLQTGAIRLNLETPFLWASGSRMPIYNDNRLLLGSAKHRQLITKGFRDIIKNQKIEVDVIAGTATAGIPHATSLANILEVPLIYVRPNQKTHGMKNQIEGILLKKQKVVVVEDLISTGGSALNSVTAIRKAGGVVDHCLSIFTYGFSKAIEEFKSAHCQLHYLLTFEELISLAKSENGLNIEQLSLLQSWQKDPFSWGSKNGFIHKKE